jgi:ethanolamine utilization protein EutN
MELGRVVGQVVATVKQSGLHGRTLLMVNPVVAEDPDRNDPGRSPFVAADYIGAGLGELVLVAQGSASRVEDGTAAVPTDAAVVGIVDSVTIRNQTVFRKSQ